MEQVKDVENHPVTKVLVSQECSVRRQEVDLAVEVVLQVS